MGDLSIPTLAGVRSPQQRRLTYSSWRITTHSSRRRFAARLSSGVSAQEILGLVRGLRKQQVPAWDRVKPRGFARRWASVTNPLVLVATGLKSVQIVGLAGMSFPTEKRKDRRANNSFKPTPFRCVACVRSLRSHTSPHRSRRGLTQALALKKSWVLFADFGNNRFPRGTA